MQDMQSQHLAERTTKESHFATGLFWGIILGATGMFLFGTKKGKKFKKYLSEHGSRVLEELEELYEAEQSEKNDQRSSKSKKEVKEPTEQKNETKDLGHIAMLQQRGRKVARKFFTRSGRTLK